MSGELVSQWNIGKLSVMRWRAARRRLLFRCSGGAFNKVWHRMMPSHTGLGGKKLTSGICTSKLVVASANLDVGQIAENQ
jgi:hypothetical protein